MTQHRRTVLLLPGYFLPSQRGGGLVRSAANLVEALGDEIRFRVIAYDRDIGEAAPFPGVVPGRWVALGKGEVLYLKPGVRFPLALARALRSERYDAVYILTLFRRLESILPRSSAPVPRPGAASWLARVAVSVWAVAACLTLYRRSWSFALAIGAASAAACGLVLLLSEPRLRKSAEGLLRLRWPKPSSDTGAGAL